MLAPVGGTCHVRVLKIVGLLRKVSLKQTWRYFRFWHGSTVISSGRLNVLRISSRAEGHAVGVDSRWNIVLRIEDGITSGVPSIRYFAS
jgi:hypothetical protein